MKLCKNCQQMTDICAVYQKAPPSNGFAEKCKHYQQNSVIEIVPEPVANDCKTCGHNIDNYCLRFDHPEWEYNFVKIKGWLICNRQ